MLTTAVSQESAAIAVPFKTEARASSSYRPTQSEGASRAFETDVIVQLKSNLAQLEDLHARMHFMMSEVGYLLKTT